MSRPVPALAALAVAALLLSLALPGTHAFMTTADRRPARGLSRLSSKTSTRTRTRVDRARGIVGRGIPSTTTAVGGAVLRASAGGGGDGDGAGDAPLGSSLRGLTLRETVEVGDRVVCKRSVPDQGVYENASYEVRSIYVQSFDDETQTVRRVGYDSLDDGVAATGDLYMTLYSPRYHEGGEGAVVTPDEAGLVTVRSELTEAAWLAVPGFVWIVVASTFYSVYHERTGGSLADAFLGR